MSTSERPRVLIVDDDPMLARALTRGLHAFGYEAIAHTTPAAGLDALRDEPFDLVLVDLRMPDMGGLEFLVEATRIDPLVAAVVMTGGGSIQEAVLAMKNGAIDFILKPIDLQAMMPVLSRAAGIRRLKLENLQLRDTVAIHELSQAIAHTQDQAELLDRIVDATLAQFEADEACIMLLSEDGQSLYVASIRGGHREGYVGHQVAVGQGIAGWVAAHGEVVQIHDGVATPSVPGLHERTDIRSSLCLPMITRGQLVGTLSINCIRERRPFPPGQINLVSIFTNAAAASIRNAVLLEQERRADARYREVLEMVDEAVVTIDGQLRIVVLNPGAAAVFGCVADDLLGKPIDELWARDIGEVHRWPLYANFFRGAMPGERTERMRLIGRRRDGSLVPLEASFSTGHGDDPLLTTLVLRDATNLIEHERKVARLTRLYATLSAAGAAIVRSHSREEILSDVCHVAQQEGGFTLAWAGRLAADGSFETIASTGAEPVPSLILGESPVRYLLTTAVEQGRAAWDNAITGLDGLGEVSAAAVVPFIVKNEVDSVMVLLSDAAGVFGGRELRLLRDLASDVSYGLENITREEQVAYLATHDALTGLANRAAFVDRIAHAIATAQRTNGSVAVVVTDIERFGQINQTFGRDAGDAILVELAERYRAIVQDPYSLARLGVDYFAAIRTDVRAAAELAKSVGERVGIALAPPFVVDGQKLHLAGRAGIATYPLDGDTAESLLANAETALRRAKSSQDRLALYTPDMNTRVIRQMALEARLRHALDRDELVLHYQPKIHLLTGRIAGVEALLRWQDEETGLVPPGEFIHVMEETLLILEVGRWVMLEAARVSAELTDAFVRPIRVAVNVSPMQLRHDDFLPSVEMAARSFGSRPPGLDIEVTEGVVMHDIEANVRTLRAVRDLGVGVAIDDFGSGYSSLAYLARLPADTVKIDRSFISTMLEDPDHTSIVSTVISLAHSLERTVVAEGVEDEAQARLLRLLRCDQVQGYLFGHPLTLDALKARLAADATLTAPAQPG